MASVTTEYGIFNGISNSGVECFLGIRYAKAPIGDLRWKKPCEPDKSNEEYDAGRFGDAALQPFYYEGDYVSAHSQSEDCLFLNIWTKKTDGKMPVMVYIHGGAGIWGSGCDPLYNGENLARRHDVVVININYRLNAFGFLDLEKIGGIEYADSKNLGIYDQIAALRWIKRNIAAFGGDPDNITVIGESAGAASLSILLLAEEAKGLFQKAIIQSGPYNIARREMTERYTKEVTETFMEMAGVSTFDELKALSGEKIKEVTDALLWKLADVMDGIFMPVIDGKLVPKDPYKAIEEGDAKGIKLLIGTNKDEFLLWPFIAKEYTELFENLWFPLHVNSKEDFEEDMSVYNKYLASADPAKNELLDRKFMLAGDLCFRQGSIAMAEAQCRHEDTYMYEFHWETPELGACHGVEISFVFNTADAAEYFTAGTQPQKLTLDVQDAWASFAKSGDPNHDGIPAWHTYECEKRRTMIINEEWHELEDPRGSDRELLAAVQW